MLSLVLAATLAACGGSGPNAADTVAQPPLTDAQPTTAATPPPAATSTGTATAPTTTARTTTATSTQTATATTPTQTSTAPTGGAQAGCPSAFGGFIRNVQARGTDCGRALSVASAWFTAIRNGAAPTSQVSASGYACSAAVSGERASVNCTGASGTISFTASP